MQRIIESATRHDITAYNWKEDDAATLEAFREASAEMYDDVPGHEIVLNFAPGEYQKILRFCTIDDAVSEDDEQVLFVLSHAENCEVSDNPTGYMNILDNESADEVTYVFSQDTYIAEPGAADVTAELKRIGGTARTTTVSVGSAGGSAVSDKDYEPFMNEYVFMPGQTAKQITVPIKQSPASEELWFSIRTDDNSASAKIILKPQFESLPAVETSYGKNRLLLQGGGSGVPSRSISVDLSSYTNESGSAKYLSGDKYTLNNVSDKLVPKSGISIDLTMANKIGFKYGESGNGTKYTKKSGCSTKTYYEKGSIKLIFRLVK